MPREPSPQLLYDGASVSGKRTAGQKIIMFVLILIALVMTFVVTALNSRRALQGREYADGSSSAQFSDPSQLRSELIEAARRKRAQLVPEPIQIDSEIPLPAPIQAPIQPKIIVLQPNPPVVQQPRRNVPRVTDTEREEAKRYRELKATSLSSKSSVDGFEKSVEATPSGTQSGGNYSYRGSPDGITAAQIQEILAMAGVQTPADSQAKKLEFLMHSGAERTPQGYSENVRQPQVAKMELKAGTVIPGLLITGINSDLPGMVIGQVSENVYDTATGRWLLIPQGSRLIGVYDSNISYGQKRVGIVWNRLIYPDGSNLNIAGSPGADMAGYSGINGKVDNHYGQLLSAAIFTSLFTAAVDIVNDDKNNNNNEKKNARDILVETTATTIANIGAKMADKALDIQPTILIKPGARFNVMIQQDIIFPVPWVNPKTQVAGF